MNFQLKRIIKISVCTSVICVIAPLSIVTPFSIVPISLSTLIIYTVLIILGGLDGTVSVVLYILLGMCGLPVFSGYSGGIAKVLGPTGGYIIGYIFMSFISGIFIDKNTHMIKIIFGMIFGTIILYVFGTFWLMFQTKLTFVEALFAGVIPFILGDIIKIILAYFIGIKLKKVLNKIGD